MSVYIPNDMPAPAVDCLRDQAHQPHAPSSVNQINVPCYLVKQ
jgi:hypothetical protein